ncbi:MAG: acetoacetate--CoA ligase, partial [Pelagibacterales bacterium]|nr:acetoacetate--CoA ligase [Pelagibacterales bacterium]
MKSKILWRAKQSQKNVSNLYRYEKFLFLKYKLKVTQKYSKLLRWSINNPNKFWSSIWDFGKVKGIKSQKYQKSNIFFKNKFLKNSKLNFAENLLAKNDDSKAITFISENGTRKVRSWRELNKNVYKLIAFFKSIKIKKKDRIAAYLPNLIETVESFIA